MVSAQVKGSVKYNQRMGGNKMLEKKRELMKNHTEELRKKLALKDTRTKYINSILEKYNKWKAKQKEMTQQPSLEMTDKNLSLGKGNYEGPPRAQSMAKVNIYSNSMIAGNKKNELEISRIHSYSQLGSNFSTAPHSHHKPNPRLQMTSKSFQNF